MVIQKKVCLLGDFAVGKTSLIQRYVYNQFSENYLTTIGVHITKKELRLGKNSIVLIIWDLAGDDGMQKVTAPYLAGAAGAILVGDLSRSETIGHLSSQLRIFEEINPGSSIIVALNKVDLLAEPADVQGAARMAGLPNDMPLFLTSCKTGENVESVFASLAGRILG